MNSDLFTVQIHCTQKSYALLLFTQKQVELLFLVKRKKKFQRQPGTDILNPKHVANLTIGLICKSNIFIPVLL